MDLSSEGAAFIRAAEGFVGTTYRDSANVATIGIGFTWRSAGFREWWSRNRPGQPFDAGSKMSRGEADKALQFICAVEYGKALNKFLNRDVPQHVFDGALSPVYNLGPGSLKWRWALALRSGDFEEAAKLLVTTGTTAAGIKLAGLVKRRREEADLIRHGDYVYGKAIPDAMGDGVLIRGERGEDVAELQADLLELGHYSGEVDGIFGYGTEAAVLEFQRAAALNADGYVGPLTLKAIAFALETPTAPAEPVPGTTPAETPETPPQTASGVAGWAILIGTIIAGGVIACWQFIEPLLKGLFS